MTYIRNIVTSAFGERLEKLIKMRIGAGTRKAAIDKRIWDLFGEDWCIMFTDLSGFSRNVSKFGIIHFLQIIFESHRIFTPIIEEHDGILVKSEGDSLLVIYRNAEKALRAAFQMQRATGQYNKDKVAEERILLCVGLGYGKCLRIGDVDIFGMEVNAASKLGEDKAKAGDVLITAGVRKMLDKKAPFTYTPLADLPSGIKHAYKVTEEK